MHRPQHMTRLNSHLSNSPHKIGATSRHETQGYQAGTSNHIQERIHAHVYILCVCSLLCHSRLQLRHHPFSVSQNYKSNAEVSMMLAIQEPTVNSKARRRCFKKSATFSLASGSISSGCWDFPRPTLNILMPTQCKTPHGWKKHKAR